MREGSVFEHVSEICSTSPSHGGLGLDQGSSNTAVIIQEVNLLLAACTSEPRPESSSPLICRFCRARVLEL